MSAVLDQLRLTFPMRIAIRADEVAMVLRGSDTRGVVQRVRENMKSGRYPGACKIDGHWQLPLTDLAAILAPAPKATPVLPSATGIPTPSHVGRRKSVIGPRLRFIREGQFWERVFAALGFHDDAKEIAKEVSDIRRSGREERDEARAAESSSSLQDALNDLLDSKFNGKEPII